MVFGGLVHGREPRGEDQGIDDAELVEPGADHEAKTLREDLVLNISADLGAILGASCERDVEVVAPEVGTVAQDLGPADEAGVADLEVERLRFEIEMDGR